MRIDFLTDLLPPGIPNFLPLQLAEFLKNRGHRVFIRNAATANRIIKGPLGYMPEPDESEDDNSFKTRWARKRPDLVYMMLTAMRDESVVELVGSLEIPAVLDLRSWRLGEDELEKLAVEIADVEHQGIYILVQTEHVATQLRELGLNQVICLDQGVDRRLFHSSRHDERLRDCWQCQPGCPVIGLIDWEQPREDTETILTWCRPWLQQGKCRLVLMTADPQGVEKKLMERFPELVIQPVRSLDDQIRCMSSIDIFLAASQDFSNRATYREALSCGKMVIYPGVLNGNRGSQPLLAPVRLYSAGDENDFQSVLKEVLTKWKPTPELEAKARELTANQDVRRIYSEIEEILRRSLLQPDVRGSGRAPRNAVYSCRTIFLSDIHLGTTDSKANECRRFLKHIRAEKIVLIGDIVDAWALSRGSSWSNKHGRLVRTLLRKLDRENTEIIYLRGNHDEIIERFMPMTLGNLHFDREYMHHSADGKTYLCIHGDGFDSICSHFKWIAHLGSVGYDILLWFNRIYNKFRAWRGKAYYSISKAIKGKVKSAVSFIDNYEKQLEMMAKRRNCDGIIAGHIHQGADKMIGPTRYLNCGDWVESLSAVIEEHDGTMRLIHYDEWMRRLTVEHAEACFSEHVERTPNAE